MRISVGISVRVSALAGLLVAGALPLQAGPSRPVPIPHVAPQPRAMPGSVDPAAQALLTLMLRAENSLLLSGDQVTLVVRNGLDLSSEQQVQRSGTRALRLVYLRPARLAGEEYIDNGRFLCHFVPSKNTLELSPSRVQSLRVRVPQVIRQIKSGRLLVQQVGQETVAGHACVVLQVMVRSNAAVPSQKFWVDPENGAQLRNEQYDAQSHLRSASYYTQVVYNPVFAPSTFRLPRGGRVVAAGFAPPTLTLDQVRAQAAFPIQVPAVLPTGFRFQGGSVSPRGNSQVVELRYSSGAIALSVFETPERPGLNASPPQHPRSGVLFARRNGLKIVIIANLANADLDNTLASLR